MKQIIKKPIITEKSVALSEKRKYVFEINKDANKREVAKAVKDLYHVDVISVNITKRESKTSRFGRQERVKPGKKLAIATLKKDQKIDIFESQEGEK